MKKITSLFIALTVMICCLVPAANAAAITNPNPNFDEVDYIFDIDVDMLPNPIVDRDDDDDVPAKTPLPTPTPTPAAATASAASATNAAQLVGNATYTSADLYMAAQLIYAEGKNQSDESFLAMACVVYNRLASKKFPNTIEAIVFQKGQFTVVKDREKFLALAPSQRAINAISAVFIQGERPLPPEVMFFKSARLSKKWGARVYYATIGGNMYYS